jgi:hypothetical protein
MTQLVRYEEMRARLAECARVDEVEMIKRDADKLHAYAKLAQDADVERWTAEIRLRARIRIGQLSAGMETAQGARTELPDSDVAKSKTQKLEEAGINIRTAERYEELAGGKDEAAQQVAAATAETYFAKQSEAGEPATMDGLRGAIRDALVETLGEPETRKVVSIRHKADPVADALTDLGGAMKVIADLPAADMAALAGRVQAELLVWYLDYGNRASLRLDDFLTVLEARQDAA